MTQQPSNYLPESAKAWFSSFEQSSACIQIQDDEIATFTDADLSQLPSYDNEQGRRLFDGIEPARMATEWSMSMVESSSVSCSTLALFVHLVFSSSRLHPCQADVNGKRFSNPKAAPAHETQDCSIMAVPYMTKPMGEENCSDPCRVLPMTFDGSVACGTGGGTSQTVAWAEGLHSLDEISETFKILFDGGGPSDDEL